MNICRLSAPVIAMLSLLFISSTASAAPLDPDRVPADAKWVIHVDLEALSGTALADQVRQKRPQMVALARRWFQNQYGIDPREDFDGLTMFSDTYESHTGTAILQSGYDREKVKGELEKKPEVRTETWENHTLYTISKEKEAGPPRERGNRAQNQSKQRQAKSVTIILLDDKTAIFASSADRAKAAVKLVQGNAPSLEKDSKLLAEHKEGAMVYGAAIDLNQITQRESIFPVLRQHEKIYCSAGEEDGEFFRRLTLVAQSEEVAEQMKTALEGSVAFSKVWAADSDSLKRMAEEAEITRDGKTVQFRASNDTETVLNALGDIRDRLQKRFEAVRN